MKKLLVPLSVMFLLTTWSLPANAVMLWIDQWYNHTQEDYEFHKSEGVNAGKLEGLNCGNRKWSEVPTKNKHIKLCPSAHIHKVTGGAGYAMPWYGSASNHFILHRYRKGSVRMHIAHCGEHDDCLYAYNDHTGDPLHKFPITLGKRGNCALSVELQIKSDHKIEFTVLNDSTYDCESADTDMKTLKDGFIDAAPELAKALITR